MAPKRKAGGPPSSTGHGASSAAGSSSAGGASAEAAKRLRFATDAGAAAATAAVGGSNNPSIIARQAAAAAVSSSPSAPGSSRYGPASRAGNAAEDDEDDHAGDIELEDQDRKRAQQGRKGRIVTEMSDSESEDEDEEPAGKAGKGGGDEDEDEDMFAADPTDKGKGKAEDDKKKAKEKFLKLKDIEGQEFGKRTRAPDLERADLEAEPPGSEDDLEDVDTEFELESSEEEEEEEDQAVPDGGQEGEDTAEKADGDKQEDPTANGADEPIKGLKKRSKKKMKKGMGYKIESFNVEAEMESGRFDEDGNYIANAKDPHAEHDNWLQGNYNRKAIKAAREAAKKREEASRAKAVQDQEEALNVNETQKRLAELMHRGESVLEALQRIGKDAKKDKGAAAKKQKVQVSSKGKEKADSMDVDQPEAQAQKKAARQALDDITAYTSSLMSEHGMINIYDETYEGLVRVVRRSGLVSGDWDPARDAEQKLDQANGSAEQHGDGNAQSDTTSNGVAPHRPGSYVYKWTPEYLAATSDGSTAEQQIFGPYPITDLKEWSSQGYFGPSNERIVLKESGEGSEWKTWDKVVV